MNLTPRGVHKCSRPELLLDPFHLYSILVCLEWVLMGILHISMDENCEKLNFRPYFDKILAFDPLWCSGKVGRCTFSKLYYTYFNDNFDFSWFFMIIFVKMPKNVQNLAKMQKIQVFSPFQDPLGCRPKTWKNIKNIFYTHLGVF